MLNRWNSLLIGLALLGIQMPAAIAQGTWQKTAGMKSARNAFPIAISSNNNIFMIGGRTTANTVRSGSTTATTEYINFGAATPTFTRTGSLFYSRSFMPAVPVQSSTGSISKVLLPGGFSSSYGTLRTAEIFDVVKGTSTTTGSMSSYREQFDAVSLSAPASGYAKVLAIGGFVGGYNTALSSCELYNYATGKWSPTASLHTGRFGTTSLLLPAPDNRVIVVGGRTEPSDVSLSTVEYYTPASGTTAASWTLSDESHGLTAARFRHTMTVIGSDADGFPILLITGGYSGSNTAGQTLNTAELGLYDSASSPHQYKFQPLCIDAAQTTPLQLAYRYAGRMDHTATLISSPGSSFASSQVLVIGGWDGITGGPGTTIALPDLITISLATDLKGKTVYVGSVAHLSAPSGFATRHEQAAVPLALSNGSTGALICGGLEEDSLGNLSLSDSWVYTP